MKVYCDAKYTFFVQQPGCRVDALTTENQSALHLAASEGYSIMVEILLDHGADANALDKDGYTALHIALAKESFLQMVNI